MYDHQGPRHEGTKRPKIKGRETVTFEHCRFQRWWLYIRTLLIPVINSPLTPRWPISWHSRVLVPARPLSQLPIRHTPRTEIWEEGGRGRCRQERGKREGGGDT